MATACPEPPEGCSRRTPAPPPDEVVRLTGHEGLSRETVRRRPAENHLKPWRKDMCCIPEVDAACVAAMEDVPDLRGETPDPRHPVIRFDWRPALPVPRPSDPQLSKAEIRNRRPGTAAQQKRRENQMDVLDRQGQDKNGARISKTN